MGSAADPLHEDARLPLRRIDDVPQRCLVRPLILELEPQAHSEHRRQDHLHFVHREGHAEAAPDPSAEGRPRVGIDLLADEPVAEEALGLRVELGPSMGQVHHRDHHDPGGQRMRTVLEQMARSNPRLQLRVIDPDREPAAARAAGLRSANTAVLEAEEVQRAQFDKKLNRRKAGVSWASTSKFMAFRT